MSNASSALFNRCSCLYGWGIAVWQVDTVVRVQASGNDDARLAFKMRLEIRKNEVIRDTVRMYSIVLCTWPYSVSFVDCALMLTRQHSRSIKRSSPLVLPFLIAHLRDVKAVLEKVRSKLPILLLNRILVDLR